VKTKVKLCDSILYSPHLSNLSQRRDSNICELIKLEVPALTSSEQRFSENCRQAGDIRRKHERHSTHPPLSKAIFALHHTTLPSTASYTNSKMNVQRLGLRLGRQIRTPVLRSTLQRRFASDEVELVGAADNAFNRERAAVKAHAEATSGE
jgi:hypothetical protein